MKKIFISFLALSSMLLLMLSACKKDETKVTSSLGNGENLTASTTTPALSLATSAENAVTFSFPETPITGYQSDLTYTLQFDKKGNSFASAREISATSGGTTVTVDALNTVLHNLSLPDGVAAEVEVRVKSVIAVNVDATYSNVITLTVTPYSRTSYLYVPGAYQGWNPAADKIGVLSSPASNKIYDGEITFDAGNLEFKLTPEKNWNVSYGLLGGNLSTSGSASNLSVPSAGTYAIHVDLNTLTFTATKQ